MAAAIEITGVRELRAALAQIDKDVAKELRDALAGIAGYVAARARPKVPVRSGSAVASIKVRKQSAGAALAVGGAKAPYFPWLDFGGRTGLHKTVRRPFLPEGRYIYPTLKENRAEIDKQVAEVIDRLSARAGF